MVTLFLQTWVWLSQWTGFPFPKCAAHGFDSYCHPLRLRPVHNHSEKASQRNNQYKQTKHFPPCIRVNYMYIVNCNEKSSVGVGAHLHLTEADWRLCIRQAWLLGLLEQTMQLWFSQRRIKNMVFNTYSLTEAGGEHTVEPYSVELLKLKNNTNFAQVQNRNTTSAQGATEHTQNSKGTYLLPILTNLLSSSNNWYMIEHNKDNHFPGNFGHLIHSVLDSHLTQPPIHSMSRRTNTFCSKTYNMYRLAKAKYGCLAKCLYPWTKRKKEVYYHIAPCGGAKCCSFEGSSFTMSTREHRGCPEHPESDMVLHGECPVECVYVWPSSSDDKRSWLSGTVRKGSMETDNLHNHPLHSSTKVPPKV